MYKFETDKIKKVLKVTVSGFFSEKDAASYVAEFQSQVKQITPSNHTLVVDGSEQKVVSQNLLAEFQQVLDFYLSVGFKKVVIVPPTSSIAMMQIKKLRGFEKITFVEKPEDVVKHIA